MPEPHRRERVLDLVRHLARHLAPGQHPLGAGDVGDVVERDDHAAHVGTQRRELEREPPAADLQLGRGFRLPDLEEALDHARASGAHSGPSRSRNGSPSRRLAPRISTACGLAISTRPAGSRPTTPVATVASTAAVRFRASSSACWLDRMSAAMRPKAPNTGSNSSGGLPEWAGIGVALARAPSPSGAARPPAGRAPARRGPAPASAAPTPTSVASSSTSARSSRRTASEASSASCGVASTPSAAGNPAAPRDSPPARAAEGCEPSRVTSSSPSSASALKAIGIHELRHDAEILQHLGAGAGQPAALIERQVRVDTPAQLPKALVDAGTAGAQRSARRDGGVAQRLGDEEIAAPLHLLRQPGEAPGGEPDRRQDEEGAERRRETDPEGARQAPPPGPRAAALPTPPPPGTRASASTAASSSTTSTPRTQSGSGPRRSIAACTTRVPLGKERAGTRSAPASPPGASGAAGAAADGRPAARASAGRAATPRGPARAAARPVPA